MPKHAKRGQTTRPLASWKLERILKLAIPALILAGMIVGVPIWLYSTFAQAEDTNRKFDALQTLIVRGQDRSEIRAVEAELRNLRREQYDILAVQERMKVEKRSLSDLEAGRLKVVSEEIGKLDGEIKRLKDKEMQDAKK